jgi:hypothetical protein
MSDWEIRLPIRSRDEPLADVAHSARGIEDAQDRAVARTIAIDAAVHGGMRTAGELIDHLEAAGPAGRRPILDDAREAAGLERSEDIDSRERFEAIQRQVRRRAANRPIPTCAVCGVHPTGAGGMPGEAPTVRKWHCPHHEHLAEPGDMDPPPLPIDLNLRVVDPDEIAAAEREDERLREQFEHRRRERAAEAEVLRVARER